MGAVSNGCELGREAARVRAFLGASQLLGDRRGLLAFGLEVG
jgi:hypothetical protein